MNVFTTNDKLKSQSIDENFAGLANGSEMHFGGEWLEYDVGWSVDNTTTAPDIGNGYIHGRYIRLGRLVIVRVFFKAGSTTTFGATGVWRFSLPILPATTDYPSVDVSSTNWITGSSCGGSYIEDLSTIGYTGYCRLLQHGGLFAVGVGNMGAATYTNQNDCSSGIPHVWASGDFFSALISYEARSGITQ